MGKQREGGFRESRCCVVGENSLRGAYVGLVPILEEASANDRGLAYISPCQSIIPEIHTLVVGVSDPVVLQLVFNVSACHD